MLVRGSVNSNAAENEFLNNFTNNCGLRLADISAQLKSRRRKRRIKSSVYRSISAKRSGLSILEIFWLAKGTRFEELFYKENRTKSGPFRPSLEYDYKWVIRV